MFLLVFMVAKQGSHDSPSSSKSPPRKTARVLDEDSAMNPDRMEEFAALLETQSALITELQRDALEHKAVSEKLTVELKKYADEMKMPWSRD